MLRIPVVCLTIFAASVMAVTLSLLAISKAESKPSEPIQGEEGGSKAAESRVLNEVPQNPYHQVVDNTTRGRFVGPGWQKEPSKEDAQGGGISSAESSVKKDATFRVKIPETDHYTVYARWPADADNTREARFGISTIRGIQWDTVNQTIDGGEWVRIGAYEMKKGDGPAVRVSSGSDGRTVADAVMVVRNVLVGKNGQLASVGDPDVLSGEESAQQTKGGEYTTKGTTRREGRNVVRTARNHLGRRYDYAHTRCRSGIAREDCSCTTKLVYARYGRKLPDSPVYQYKYGKRVRHSRLRAGDMVFHDLNRDGKLNDHYADHVSIYSGNGNIIHASSYFGRVVESKMKYLAGYHGGKRLYLKRFR